MSVNQPKEDHQQLLPAHTDAAPRSAGSRRSARRFVLIRAALGELVATTLFMFANMSIALLSPGSVLGPVVAGFCASALIFSFAEVSGCHMNSAVSFAVWVGGKTSVFKGATFLLAQAIGSVLATLLACAVYGHTSLTVSAAALTLTSSGAIISTMVREIVTTAFLTLVIFSVVFDTLDTKNVEVLEEAASDGHVHKVHARGLTLFATTGTSKAAFAPIAIGAAIGGLAAVGGCFNPARVIGPALISWSNKRYLWVFLLSEFVGGGIGALVQRLFHYLKHHAVELEEGSGV